MKHRRTCAECGDPVRRSTRGRLDHSVNDVGIALPHHRCHAARYSAARLIDALIERDALPDVAQGDLIEVTDHCIDLVRDIRDGLPCPVSIPLLERAVGEWARGGIALEDILHATHTGFRLGLRTSIEADHLHRGPGDHLDDIAAAAESVVDILEVITTVITGAYLRHFRAASGQPTGQAIATALLSGRDPTPAAREAGMTMAPEYTVLAVRIEFRAAAIEMCAGDPQTSDDRMIRSIRDELTTRAGRGAMAVFDAAGGTLLLPGRGYGHDDLGALITALSDAGGVTMTAAAGLAATGSVSAVAEHAHRILDTVIHLGYRAGIHHVDDLALETQLARPGPARDALAAKLDPLRDHPELLKLLRVHIANALNRKITAEQFGVHTNTVDYRLKRIAQLTGLDLGSGEGAYILQSALIARGGTGATESRPPYISEGDDHR